METMMKIPKKGEELSENEESESKTSGNAATSNRKPKVSASKKATQAQICLPK